ncbi:MAG: CRTAC1 family protein [Planctomycetota bacterium]|nr:CRTAC1 family protein [Planctomycetota bacterium]
MTRRATAFAALGGVGIVVVMVAWMIGIARRDVEPLSDTPSPLASIRVESPSPESSIRFTEIAADAGVQFVYYGNPSPELYMTEQNGGGVAVIDFDTDGVVDLFLANGSNFDRPAEKHAASNRLYCGRLDPKLRYDDVTSSAGLNVSGFGMGCAVGDFDNDGFDDLFVAGYGRNQLWHNNGDGTFSEQPVDTKSNPLLWSTSAAFADLDGDGNLDLYVVNYVDYTRDDAPCYSKHNPPVRISCGPLGRRGQADLLYRNNGDGTFANVSHESGVGEVLGKGLGLSIADFDGDGRLDVYVANDTTNNLLFRNMGRMKFREVGLQTGVAVNGDGVGTGGMGVACGDYNADGRFDLLVTNFLGEPNDLYANLGADGFRPTNSECGLDSASRPVLGFGVLMADFDLDRYPDLLVSNGHVWDLTATGLGYEYAMSPQLFRNNTGQRFRDVSSAAGDYFATKTLGRASALGDLDNDGDWDVVVMHLIDPVAVLRNERISDRARPGDADRPADELASMRLKLVGTRSARSSQGTRVEATVGGHRIVLRVPSGDSFQSSSDSRVIIPLHGETKIERIRVHWTSGVTEEWNNVKAAASMTLVESSTDD